MPEKNNTEVGPYRQMLRGIEGKTFKIVALFSILLSLAAIVFGYYFYMSSVTREYRTRAWQMSRTAYQILDVGDLLDISSEVIQQYELLSEEEREQLSDKKSPLLSKFDFVYGEQFNEICKVLRRIQENNDAIAAFVAFLDPETNRRVFIIDSDPKDSFCPTGSMDVFETENFKELLYGKQDIFDEMYGTQRISSTILKMSPYGYRCMAGTQIGIIDDYPVFIFYDTDMNEATRIGAVFLCLFVALLTLITIVVVLTAVSRMNKMIVMPVDQLTNAAKTYIADKSRNYKDRKVFANLNIKTGDELETLSETMKLMESDIHSYFKNLTQVTAERERIHTELSLASRIQAAMLPHQFPPFPDRKEIEIFASMNPAKEVGGDFYDFFFIDDDHLCLVIADVSGKGIPGALFMMVSKIIIQSCAMLGRSAAEILNKTNEAICSNNQEEMFVTVWVGILELSTGRLQASNAGHEYPVFRHANGEYALMKDKHGLVIGAMDIAKYSEYTVELEPGSSVFVYTDGVPEATDESGALFGFDRMVETLNKDPNASPQEVLENINQAVNDFVKDAEQFDDLTMLCLKYNGPVAKN